MASHIKNIYHILFWSLLFLMTIILFLFLQPKLSSRITNQDSKRNTFVHSITETSSVDPKKYWEFREFYSPGRFRFDKNGLSPEDIDHSLKLYLPEKDQTPYLTFSSDKFLSVDSVTTLSTLEAITAPIKTNKHVVYEDKSTLLTEDNDFLYLIFLKPYKDFENTSGFFEHWGGVPFSTKGKYWLNISVIKK